jgi:hypothetical protein
MRDKKLEDLKDSFTLGGEEEGDDTQGPEKDEDMR